VKAAPFAYRRPGSLEEALDLLAEHREEARPLAGGQSLVPLMAMRLAQPALVVDLAVVPELRGREGGRVGAMVTNAALERDPAGLPPVAVAALPHIGHFQVRNRGTVGGSIAHADPASELPAVALALDAELEVVGPNGTRRVPASEFFLGTWTTTVEADEILSAVHFPVWPGRAGFAVEEVARRSGDFALTGVVAAVELNDRGAVQRSAISFLGMAPTPVRARTAEAQLTGASPSAPDLTEIARLAVTDTEPTADVHASAEYRQYVGAHLVERALDRALGAARRG